MEVIVPSNSVHSLLSSPTQGNMSVKEPVHIDGNRLLARKPKFLTWKRPSSTETIVINCDGSYRSSIGTVGYGYIMRDYIGRLVLGKAVHFQKVDYINNEVDYETVVVLAEMLAILDGLQHAKKLGIRRVEIQSDSKLAISIINGWIECPLPLSTTHSAIRFEASFFEDVEFNFVYRECNRAADFLSKFLKEDGRLYFDLLGIPDKLQRIINEDALGFINIRF